MERDCNSYYDCCDCGDNDCGCAYCWSCQACDSCELPLPNQRLWERLLK